MPVITLITEAISCEHCMDVFDDNFHNGCIQPVSNDSCFEFYYWSQNVSVRDPVDWIENLKLLEIKEHICHDVRVAVLYPKNLDREDRKPQEFYCVNPKS